MRRRSGRETPVRCSEKVEKQSKKYDGVSVKRYQKIEALVKRQAEE